MKSHLLRPTSYTLGIASVVLSLSAPASAEPRATLNCNGEMGSILSSRIQVDPVAHHTQHFAMTDGVVARRGGVVHITMTFDKNPERACFDLDIMLLDALTGGEAASIDFQPSSAVEKGGGGFTQTYAATLPADLPIGLYRFTGELGSAEGEAVVLGSAEGTSLYVMFDPYDPASPTYLDEKPGAWLGAETVSIGLDAAYSLKVQIDPFAAEAVSAAMASLKTLSPEQRRDPAVVSAALARENARDRVLWGRWDGSYKAGQAPMDWLTGTYDDGKKPWEWTGSTEFLKGTGKRAKYGQCMIFAAVLTSTARSVGIPTRPVTNFDSAHESIGLTVAGYGPSRYPSLQTTPAAVVFTKGPDGGLELDEALSADRIWNFHVWTEVYVQRADLEDGDGWNAFDATPQEQSDGRLQAGTPVNGLLAGQKYDGAFIAGETNAKVVVTLRAL